MQGLKYRVALVTGATSGIGREVAEALARAGARVVVSGRDEIRGESVMSRLDGGRHEFIKAELGTAAAAEQLHAMAKASLGPIDILVNSAGVVHHHTVLDTTDAVWEQTMAVNVGAVFYLSRAVLPDMIAAGGGVIVNIASTWGLVGAEQTAAYCASKGAVIQLTRSMAADHASQHVRINAVCPGAVDTSMLSGEACAFGLTVEQGRELWAQDAANKRLARAEDVAAAVVFLSSDAASHIHGVALPVDGGAIAT